METNFAKIGFKAGLEVHQQLDTGKLFCRCPSTLREDKPNIVFKRRLRAVASEMGEFDRAALEAFKKGFTFEYQGYSDTTCLIEADEAPPLPCDKDALDVTLKVSLMADATIMDRLVVMRKAVIDGSNTSGFQRTMLVSVGGKLKLKNKEVGIQSMAIEEDACRPIERREREVVYRLDRLGIPLIELATDPDLKTPEEVKECAKKIGELFRRTCSTKRGLGTIRQDVNISIAEGARVEIKGVQELELIDEFARREVQRQIALVELRAELKNRGLKPADIKLEPMEVSELFKGSECKFIKGKIVFGSCVKGFSGLLGKELQQGRRFGTELAGYVKSKAGLKGILHSDELPAYGISDKEVSNTMEKLGCGKGDAFILVQAEKAKAGKAFAVLQERIEQAFKGVPEETRNALEGGNTEYSRPLPGAARMYPETDLEPVTASTETLERLKKELPLTVGERSKLYKKQGLSEKLVQKMVLSNKACFFETLLKKGLNATAAATLLLETTVQLKRQHAVFVSNEMVEAVLVAGNKGKISKDVYQDVLLALAKNPKKNLEEIVKGLGMGKAKSEDISGVISKIVEKNSALVESKGMHAIGALMGDAMRELKGKADGSAISAALKEEIAKRAKK